MECRECGAEVQVGSYFCGCCGRPMAPGAAEATGLVEPPDLGDLPLPSRSREAPSRSREARARSGEAEATGTVSRRDGFFICHQCMGAHRESSAVRIDGLTYCGDCAPVESQRLPSRGVVESGSLDHVPVLLEERPVSGAASGWWRGGVVVTMLFAGAAAFFLLRGGDRIDELLAGVDTGREEKVLLRHSLQAGQSESYRADARMEMEVSGRQNGLLGAVEQDLECEIVVGGVVRMDVLSVDEQGIVNLAIRFEGFEPRVKAVVNGEEQDVKDALPLTGLGGMTIQMKVDAWGEPVGSPDVVGGPTGLGMEELFFEGVQGVPHREIGVGDTWTARETGLMEGLSGGADLGGGPAVIFRYEVVGFKQIKGRDCLVISVEGELFGGDSSCSLPGMMDADMDMALQGVFFYDAQTGLMVKAAMDLSIDMALSMGEGSFEAEMKLEFDIDLE